MFPPQLKLTKLKLECLKSDFQAVVSCIPYYWEAVNKGPVALMSLLAVTALQQKTKGFSTPLISQLHVAVPAKGTLKHASRPPLFLCGYSGQQCCVKNVSSLFLFWNRRLTPLPRSQTIPACEDKLDRIHKAPKQAKLSLESERVAPSPVLYKERAVKHSNIKIHFLWTWSTNESILLVRTVQILSTSLFKFDVSKMKTWTRNQEKDRSEWIMQKSFNCYVRSEIKLLHRHIFGR